VLNTDTDWQCVELRSIEDRGEIEGHVNVSDGNFLKSNIFRQTNGVSGLH
jgi:hypothetical protein